MYVYDSAESNKFEIFFKSVGLVWPVIVVVASYQQKTIDGQQL